MAGGARWQNGESCNGQANQEAGIAEVGHEAATLQEMSSGHLEEDPTDLYLDLRPYMDMAPLTVRYVAKRCTTWLQAT